MSTPVLTSIPDNLPETIRERMRLVTERRSALAAAAATRAVAAALPPSPEALLKEQEEALALEERQEADTAAWSSALAKYGKGRVGKIATVDGTIILRVVTGAESDGHVQRIGGASEAVRTAVAKECTLDGVEHPSREKVRAICDRWPGVWLKMYELRDALASGEENALVGKA